MEVLEGTTHGLRDVEEMLGLVASLGPRGASRPSPSSTAPRLSSSFAAELRSKYSDFLRARSSALHAKGFKMSECVGSYPTRDGGIAVYYDARPHAIC